MNKCFFAAQIATWPQKSISHSGQNFTKLLIRLPNPKKGQAHFYINASAIGEVGTSLCKWYNKGDYLIFEGYLQMKKYYKRKNQPELIIIRDYPVYLGTD